jgi:hypothetical protein
LLYDQYFIDDHGAGSASFSMRISTLTISVFVSLLVFQTFSIAQSTEAPVLVDELGAKLTGETLLSRLDNFAAELSNDNARGVIIFYQSNDPIMNIFTYRFFQSHRVTRKIGDLYRVVPTLNATKSGIEFWIERGGKVSDPQVVEPSYKLDLSQNSRPVFFGRGLFERVNLDGEWTVLDWDCASVCISWLSIPVLGTFIDENPGSIAYFILRGTRKRSDIVKAHLMDEAKESGLSTRNARFLYAGPISIDSNQEYVEVEAFISTRKTSTAKDFPYQSAENN